MSLKRDFHPQRNSLLNQKSKVKLWIIGAGCFVVIFIIVAAIILFNYFGDTKDRLSTKNISVEDLPETAPPVTPSTPAPVRKEIAGIVPAGSSMTALLGDYFDAKDIYNLDRQSREVFPLTKICAGHPYKIVTVDDEFDSFIYEIDDQYQLIIHRKDGEINIEKEKIVYDVTPPELIQGTIRSNLLEAVHKIGENQQLAFLLADIFAWDIDFIRDLRVGDTFQVLVEKRFRDGRFAGYGKVIAAEFVNQKKVFKAIRFQDGTQRPSYYNEKGENLQKIFLKAPLAFNRISSGFTMHRFHPILKTWKSHPAIDYVAPVGTPIKTVGDGTIYRIGYTRGNGNFIEVRH